MAFAEKSLKPVVQIVNFAHENKFNHALLMSSFNMTAGMFCLGATDEEFFVYCIDKEYFEKFNLEKTINILSNVNDDNLV